MAPSEPLLTPLKKQKYITQNLWQDNKRKHQHKYLNLVFKCKSERIQKYTEILKGFIKPDNLLQSVLKINKICKTSN